MTPTTGAPPMKPVSSPEQTQDMGEGRDAAGAVIDSALLPLSTDNKRLVAELAQAAASLSKLTEAAGKALAGFVERGRELDAKDAEIELLRNALREIARAEELEGFSDWQRMNAAAEHIRYHRDTARYALAQAIEARRAETGTGSVHESAVRQDAPKTTSQEEPTHEASIKP